MLCDISSLSLTRIHDPPAVHHFARSATYWDWSRILICFLSVPCLLFIMTLVSMFIINDVAKHLILLGHIFHWYELGNKNICSDWHRSYIRGNTYSILFLQKANYRKPTWTTDKRLFFSQHMNFSMSRGQKCKLIQNYRLTDFQVALSSATFLFALKLCKTKILQKQTRNKNLKPVAERFWLTRL